MNTVFIQTVTGKDRAHLIKDLSKATRALDGQWLKTKLIRVHHHFAAMMVVSIDDAKEAELKSNLEKSFPELDFSYDSFDEIAESHASTATVVVDCEDRPGLTREITQVLAELDLKAENMESHRLPVAPVGGTVYNARMTVLFPDEASREELMERLEAIAGCSHITYE